MADEKPKVFTTTVNRKKDYKMFEIYPLHIKHPGIHLPVEEFSLNQQFSPKYAKEEAYGRMDPIMTYSNTTRSVRIRFVCQSHHFIDGVTGVSDNINSINMLTQMLYPSYQGVGPGQALLKAPPFFKIKYGQYLGSYGPANAASDGLTGVITSFSHDVGATAKNYAYSTTSDKKHMVLPRKISVSFSFEVVHDKEVGWRDIEGKAVFSHEGYGSNFPYNTGVPKAVSNKENPKKSSNPTVASTGDQEIKRF
jgi:hypothetical protein